MIACFGSCLAGNGGNRRDPLRFSLVDAMAATGCSLFFFPGRCGAANPLENGGSTADAYSQLWFTIISGGSCWPTTSAATASS